MRIATSTRRRIGLAAAVLLGLGAGTVLRALFEMPEIRRVPVERLAQNIERQLAARPDDVALRLNLGRLHAMAYALKTTEFEARGKGDELKAWFEPDAPHMPGPVMPASSRERDELARQELAKAVRVYADVVARAPDNFIARLGYAWSLEQSGDKPKAIAEYRKVVELGWPKESGPEALFKEAATSEAAGRLSVLLDPVADEEEILALAQKQQILGRKGRAITPIIIPLRAGVETPPLATGARVLFDADGSGVLRQWTWIQRDAGWLVHDPHMSGRITSALQWFGNVTFWLFWTNGYQAMAALDDDDNGRLSGRELRDLAIWRDANQNGFSEPGEVLPLSAHSIVALACDYVAGDGVTLAAHSPAGVTFANGTTRPTFDVILRAVGPVPRITTAF